MNIADHHIVEMGRHGIEIVMHGNHHSVFGLEFAQNTDNRPLARRVDAGERLIHDVDARLLGKRPSEEYASLRNAIRPCEGY